MYCNTHHLHILYTQVFYIINVFFIDTSVLVLVTITFSIINKKCLYQSNLFQFYVLFTSYLFRLYLNSQTDVVQYLSLLAVADALGCKICVMRDKKNVLDCLEDVSLRNRISLNFNDSCLHVLPMNKLNPKVCILNICLILCNL